MGYRWNWAIFLSPVATGEPTTYLGWMISGFEATLAVSLAGWFVALLVGIPVGIARMAPNRLLTGLSAGYVALFRNTPLIVQLFVWVWVLPAWLPQRIERAVDHLSPTQFAFSASMLCLGLFTSARIGEQVRAGLEAIPRGQRDAALALGLSQFQAYRHVLLPTALRIIVSPLTSEWLNLLKNSAVASTIGLLELAAQAQRLVDYTSQAYEAFIAVTLCYFVLTGAIMAGMRVVEAKCRLPGRIRERGR